MNLIELFEEFIDRDALRICLELNERGSKTRVPDRFFHISSKIYCDGCDDIDCLKQRYKEAVFSLKDQKARYDKAMGEISTCFHVRYNGSSLSADLIYYQDQQ